ncbi:formate/nitrite transporter family protein [Lentibacillus lipolyticus]|nr:formate/nitrite transporter family protein [Lentibacillus lipolyticus]
MAFLSPQQIAKTTAEAGHKKANFSQPALWVLGFFGGAFINLGFLLDIRVTASMPEEWGSFANFIGAAVFPLGLILILLGGAELLTGNMMALPLVWFAKKIHFGDVMKNWLVILISNFIGSLFIAYFFGHVVGLTETGAYLDATVSTAHAKVDDPFLISFISAIGCNWLVCLAVWLSYGAQDFVGKILGIWFPIMAFVAIGFQHVVANMFIVPAAIFAGEITWMQYLPNFVSVLLGNIVGGTIFVALAYFVSYRDSFE